MGILVSIPAIYTVLIKRVTESTTVVYMDVQKESDVTKVYSSVFQKGTNTLIMVDAYYIYMMLSLLKTILKYFFTIYFLDLAILVSSSNNIPITVGSLICACILIIIGVVITILVIRLTLRLTISNYLYFILVKNSDKFFSLYNEIVFIRFTDRSHQGQCVIQV